MQFSGVCSPVVKSGGNVLSLQAPGHLRSGDQGNSRYLDLKSSVLTELFRLNDRLSVKGVNNG